MAQLAEDTISYKKAKSEQCVSPIVISVEGLVKAFGSAPVLRGVDLCINAGEITAIVGRNGSGKSTLLRSIVRIIEPDRGSIRLLGEEITSINGRKLKQLRSKVGFIFQKHNLVSRLCALSNVIHGAQGRCMPPFAWYHFLAPSSLRQRAFNCLRRVGLEDKALVRVDRLSGGQSQRVAIARALMQKPEIVLADEPTASLDPAAGVETMELLRELNKRDNITVVFVSHNIEHAVKFSDRIIGLHKGRVVLNAFSKQVSEMELRRFYER